MTMNKLKTAEYYTYILFTPKYLLLFFSFSSISFSSEEEAGWKGDPLYQPEDDDFDEDDDVESDFDFEFSLW